MMDKLKKILRENKWILITFLVSLIVISVIYVFESIAPFGNNSMLDVDFYHQYGPLLNELYDRVKSGESLLYSFNTGGGIPFYRNLLNYLSSPFNIILFLFKKENIVMAFSLVIALKVVFASITFSYFLKKTFKKDGVLLVIFSLFYAFSGYFCAYYWNIMWLDGMVFLPLIVLGINKLVDEENPVFYIISLAVMLISNYFIGYMICIFSCFYFFGYFWYKGNFKIKNILKKFIMFALSSLLAAGLVAFALIPLYYSLDSISATKDTFPLASSNFTISNYIFNHLTGVNRTVFASDELVLPNVYPGLLTLVFILILFVNKKVSFKMKILVSITLLFFFFSFNINTIDFIWHAFHVPNDLPWRYSFIYVFVLCAIGYYSILKIKDVNRIKVTISFMFIFILILLASKLEFLNLNDEKVIICLIIILCYYIIYLLSFIKRIPKVVISIILIVISSIEMIYGIVINWQIDHDITSFMSDKSSYQELIEKLESYDNDLYRIEKIDYLTLNDGAWYDYNGISVFSSMAYESTAKFQRMFGLSGNNINSYYYEMSATPIYNTIFNVRYLMGNYVDNYYYSLMDVSGNYCLYKYDYPSSIAFMVNNEIEDLELVSLSPFINQSNFVLQSTGYNDVYTPIKVSGVSGGSILNENFFDNSNGEFYYILDNDFNSITLSLENEKEQNLYLYIAGNYVNSFEVDESYYSITSDEYYIADVGRKQNGIVNVTINLNGNEDGNLIFYAYSLNDEVFNKFYDKLSSGFLKVEKYSDTMIYGEITAEENEVAFTTLSYDKGYKVYVDGKKVKTKKVLDAFLGFDVGEGTHKIKIIYYPEKQTLGNVVSLISLVILIGYITLRMNNKFKNTQKR